MFNNNFFKSIIKDKHKYSLFNLKTDNIKDKLLNNNLKFDLFSSNLIINDEISNLYTIADPFLFKKDNDYYIFCEIVRKTGGKGEIGVLYLDINQKQINIKKYEIIISEKYHLSYPFIFNYKNNIYIIPETGTDNPGHLDLYKCLDFPNKWKKEKILLNSPLYDTTLFTYQDYHYIFTTHAHSRKNLVFYSKDLINDEFKPVKNIKLIYEGCKELKGAGRSAGEIFEYNNNYYRPIQISLTKNYGEGFGINKIIELSPDKYREELIFKMEKSYIHHISICDDILIFDWCNSIKITENYPLINTKTLELLTFWNNPKKDRLEMNNIFKKIGNEYKNKNDVKILDIGVETYNIYNKKLFMNENITYYQIDIEKYNDKLSCDHFIHCDITNVNTKYPEYKNMFNVIISFGVLGNVPFKKQKTLLYLENIKYLLKNDGTFYLKIDLDRTTDDYWIFMNQNILTNYFIIKKEYKVKWYKFYELQLKT